MAQVRINPILFESNAAKFQGKNMEQNMIKSRGAVG